MFRFRPEKNMLVPYVDKEPVRIHFSTRVARPLHFNQVNRNWFVYLQIPPDMMDYIALMESELQDVLRKRRRCDPCHMRSCITDGGSLPVKVRFRDQVFEPMVIDGQGETVEWGSIRSMHPLTIDIQCIGILPKHTHPYLMWDAKAATVS